MSLSEPYQDPSSNNGVHYVSNEFSVDSVGRITIEPWGSPLVSQLWEGGWGGQRVLLFLSNGTNEGGWLTALLKKGSLRGINGEKETFKYMITVKSLQHLTK